MQTLTFICQGETAAARRSAFPNDEPLTDGTERAIAALAWRPPAGAYALCGPQYAAQRTAEALGLTCDIDDALREIDYGRWAGSRLKSVAEAESEALARWLSDPDAAPHGGESISRLIGRMSAWLDARRSTGVGLVVASAPVIRAAVVTAMQAPAGSYWRFDVAPLSVTELSGDGVRWNIKCFGRPLG